MVAGEDSCSRGHGFKSQHRILDGPFATLNCLKILTINGKEVVMAI